MLRSYQASMSTAPGPWCTPPRTVAGRGFTAGRGPPFDSVKSCLRKVAKNGRISKVAIISGS